MTDEKGLTVRHYQFACDARVCYSVEAESLDRAVEAWDGFCNDLESDDSISREGDHTFSVSFPYEGPEIYDGSGVFDRKGNRLN